MTASGATTFNDTIGALEVIIDRCARDGDRAGYFAAMYLAVTTTMRERAGAGRFQDAARMERFVTGFAGRYLDAFEAWRAGTPCGESWLAAFSATQRRRPIILQHLLLGMNAHINLDLGVAASEIGGGTSSIDAVRADFDAVNDVLGELVDGCQGALDAVSPWFSLADRVGGGGDETLIRFSLVAARRHAWSVATRLSALTGSAHREIAAVDKATAVVAYTVEHPGFAASAVLLAVRARERAEPAEVMRLLRAVRPAS